MATESSPLISLATMSSPFLGLPSFRLCLRFLHFLQALPPLSPCFSPTLPPLLLFHFANVCFPALRAPLHSVSLKGKPVGTRFGCRFTQKKNGYFETSGTASIDCSGARMLQSRFWGLLSFLGSVFPFSFLHVSSLFSVSLASLPPRSPGVFGHFRLYAGLCLNVEGG